MSHADDHMEYDDGINDDLGSDNTEVGTLKCLLCCALYFYFAIFH